MPKNSVRSLYTIVLGSEYFLVNSYVARMTLNCIVVGIEMIHCWSAVLWRIRQKVRCMPTDMHQLASRGSCELFERIYPYLRRHSVLRMLKLPTWMLQASHKLFRDFTYI